MSLRRILIISLGNPGDLRNTYHSAGHIVLTALQQQLGARTQPPFSPNRIAKKPTLASIGDRYSLLQSPTYMNESGPWVAQAYREHLSERGVSPREMGLVVVHDDLEEALGVVKVRDWDRSHRGHNGVKSIKRVLQRPPPGGEGRLAYVSVGIGRPEARDKAAVSDFVLSKVSGHARGVLQGSAVRGVFQALSELEARWADED